MSRPVSLGLCNIAVRSEYSPAPAELTALDRLGFGSEADVALSPKVAARLIGFADKTLANWRVSGRGPPFRKINGKIRYMRSSLDAWVKTHDELRSTSELGRVGISPRL